MTTRRPPQPPPPRPRTSSSRAIPSREVRSALRPKAQRERIPLRAIVFARLEGFKQKGLWFDPEGTMVAELDADGVPVGVRGHTAKTPGTSVKLVLLWSWLVTLFCSLYAANDVRGSILFDEDLGQRPAWVAVANGFYEFAQKLGPVRVRETIDGALTGMKQKAPDADDAGGHEGEGFDIAAVGVDSTPSGLVTAESNNPNELRVLVVGASSIQYYLGAELERRLESYRDIRVHRFGKLGTGLARIDNFDWPKHLNTLLKGFKPHVVIGQFGGNDAQPLPLQSGAVAAFGKPEWDADYERRVSSIVQSVHQVGAKMVMLGMPITKHKKLSQRLDHVNEITQRATEKSGAQYIATWDIAVDGQGGFREDISYNGATGPMYLPDGVHYARLGASYVAERLAWRLERTLQLTPQDPKLAVAVHGEVDSRARNSKVSYLAYVPQTTDPKERFPTLYLLHGAGGSWTDYSERSHSTLRALAGRYRIVIVTPDGDENGWYLDSEKVPGARIQTYFMTELLPEIEAKLPVTEIKAIGGVSMGGNGALALALKFPGAFVSASSISGAVDLSEARTRPALIERLGPYEQNPDAWEEHSTMHLVRRHPDVIRTLPVFITVGSRDKWAPANRSLHQVLTAMGHEHGYSELPGDHTWEHFVEVLPKHVTFHAEKLKTPTSTRRPLVGSQTP